MSAPVVTRRALLVEDLARAAERANRPAAAMLLRRFPEDRAMLAVVAEDLRTAATRTGRVAGEAAGYLAAGGVRGAIAEMADHCGLSIEAWLAESCAEQGVAPEAV